VNHRSSEFVALLAGCQYEIECFLKLFSPHVKRSVVPFTEKLNSLLKKSRFLENKKTAGGGGA
jgi:hypothetical protein